MKLKKISIVFLLALLFIPGWKAFAQMPNVGFVPSNIWYSEDPFNEGDNIKIYTLVFNPDARQLSCIVIFFDNTTLLGTKDVKIPARAANDVSIDWRATAGDHTIFAKIENAKFLNPIGTYEEVYLAQNQSEQSKRNVPKKVIANLSNNVSDSVANSISNMEQQINNITPPVVAKTLSNTTNLLENARTGAGAFLENNKTSLQKEIDALNQNDTKANESYVNQTDPKVKLQELKNTNFALKPFKYTELFFLTIFSYIFKYAVIFYILLAVILFLILRFIWRLIF